MRLFTSWPFVAPRLTPIHEADLQYCLTSARLLAQRSRAQRARVGCVIFHANRRTIVGIGYNGTTPGESNLMEKNNVTLPEVIHAEDNAIRKLTWYDKYSSDLVLCVTHAPCISCAKHILRTGIQRIYFMEHYKSTEGIALLQKHHRHVYRSVL
jgi:dCMP deaminase